MDLINAQLLPFLSTLHKHAPLTMLIYEHISAKKKTGVSNQSSATSHQCIYEHDREASNILK
jgi:hypothetical protein